MFTEHASRVVSCTFAVMLYAGGTDAAPGSVPIPGQAATHEVLGSTMEPPNAASGAAATIGSGQSARSGRIGDRFDIGVPDGAGGAIVVWWDNRTGVSYRLFAQRLDAVGAPQWMSNGLPVCTADGFHWWFAAGTDGSGGIIVAWYDSRVVSPGVYAQRINAAGQLQWGDGGVPVCVAGNTKTGIAICADGAGGAILTWEDYRGGTGYADLYAQRVSSGGTPQWTLNGIVVSNAPKDQDSPVIAPDGAGGAVVAWRDARGASADIYAQRLNAAGSNLWAAGGAVVCAAAGAQEAPAIVADGAGGAIVSWQDARGSTWDIYAQWIDSVGLTEWVSGGVVLCSAGGNQIAPAIASDGAGGAIVVWEDSRGSYSDIYAQRVSALGAVQWASNGAAICTASYWQQAPLVLAEPTGGAYIMWSDGRDVDESAAYCQRISAGGTPQWGTNGIEPCTVDGGRGPYALVPDGGGGVIVLWKDYRSQGDVDCYAQRVSSAGALEWSTRGVQVFIDRGEQRAPASLRADDGGLIVTWQEKHGEAYDIRIRKFDPNAAPVWTSLTICAATGSQVRPVLCSDGGGGAIVAWMDDRAGNEDVYAQRVDASGAVVWATDGVALCTAGRRQYPSAILPDGVGGAIVVWVDSRTGISDIYAQRVDGRGVAQWVANGTGVCTATGAQSAPVLAADGAGGGIVAWNDGRNGNDDIFAQKMSGAGAAQWTANGVAVCTATGNQHSPAIAGDGAGHAIVAWLDYRTGESDVYAQRLSLVGVPQWTANGVALCNATGYQYAPRMVDDGAGGAIVAWQDYRTVPPSRVYAQRVGVMGTAQWTTNGVAMATTSTDYQEPPAIASDGAGGAILAWKDYRSGGADLYAQHVDAAGFSQWSVDGAAICTATNTQAEQTMVSDGAGGVFVAWEDHRDGERDIVFSHRLNSSGQAVSGWAGDGLTSVSVSLLSVEASQEMVTLAWYSSEMIPAAQVERCDGGAEWIVVGRVSSEGTGRVHFSDRAVAAGQRYGYRLRFQDEGVELLTTETWVDVPHVIALALEGLRPNPATSQVAIGLSLPTAGAARLEMFDAAGRRVLDRDLGALAPGRHVVNLSEGTSWPVGVYVIRLTQGRQMVTGRAVVLR